jgi:hypothetical protein
MAEAGHHYAYHAVPTNSRSFGAFRDPVVRLWGRTLRRRSQKHALTWERMDKVADAWLPQPRETRSSGSVRGASGDGRPANAQPPPLPRWATA